jgi:C4-dicarboxylate-binding protein DctP
MQIVSRKTVLAVSLATAGVLAAGNAAAQCDPGEIVIKFSHVTATTGHPKGEAAQLFADRVNERMNGKACVEVFPNSQLYNDDKVLEAMLLGDVHMAAPSLSKFEEFTKAYRIFDLPFLFKDVNAVDKFQNGPTGQKMLRAMDKNGLRGLAYWHNGMKQLSANKPLLMPSDAKGLKFRIQESDVLEAQFKALGANPQKMAFSEVYGALQTGVVDGQENTWSNIYTKKFYEVQDGTTESNHGIIDYLVVTSVEFWEGLPEDVRKGVGDILAEVTAERNALSTEINETNKKKIIDAGGVVRQLNAEQRAAWVKAMKPVWDQFAPDIGAENIEAAQASNM